MENGPKTLQQAVLYFSDRNNCREYIAARRWPNGVVCPTCGSEKVSFLKVQNRWQCSSHHAKRQFSVKVGTIFEDSPIGLDKWLVAMWLVANCKNGVSSYEIHRALDVTQTTAWFMDHRIRLALHQGSFEKLSGEVEGDETFIGGKVRNMHRRSKRAISARRDGNWGKTVVLGLLQREGKIRAAVAPSRQRHFVHSNINENVEPGTILYTDDAQPYNDLAPRFVHQFVDHITTYVDGRIHTNGLENFWSLLKRTLKGTYVSVDPVHLQAYVDEQAWRFNNRELNDAERFSVAVSGVVGKRITYDQLTGKEADRPEVR